MKKFYFRSYYDVSLRGLLLAVCIVLLWSMAVNASEKDRVVVLTATITITNKGAHTIAPYIHRITYPTTTLPQQLLERIEYKYDESYSTKQHKNGVDKYIEFSLKIPPHSKVDRQVVFYLRLKHYNYETDNNMSTVAITDSDHFFLNPSRYVESDSREIKRIARSIQRTYDEKEDQLMAAFLYPQLRLNYKNIANKGALYALRKGIGDCTEYAAVFIAIARAMGTPARMTSEFLFTKKFKFSIPNHHAAEVYLNNRWIPVDPNLALEPKLGYGFGRTSVNKIVLKRDGSWVWSSRLPGESKKYRKKFIEVKTLWNVKTLDLVDETEVHDR